jgi:TolA-binding protein
MSMQWSDIGLWLSKNSTGLLGLAGAAATGNVPAAVASLASMVGEATGKTDPLEAMAKMQQSPEVMLKLEELARNNEADIRAHHREMMRIQLEDAQKEQEEQQKTIRTGDTADDEYVRHTRPLMARQSWYATMAYALLCGVSKVVGGPDLWQIEVAMLLVSPAAAYMGFRTIDKFRKPPVP